MLLLIRFFSWFHHLAIKCKLKLYRETKQKTFVVLFSLCMHNPIDLSDLLKMQVYSISEYVSKKRYNQGRKVIILKIISFLFANQEFVKKFFETRSFFFTDQELLPELSLIKWNFFLVRTNLLSKSTRIASLTAVLISLISIMFK